MMHRILEDFTSAQINHVVRQQTALEETISRRLKMLVRKVAPCHGLGTGSSQTMSFLNAHSTDHSSDWKGHHQSIGTTSISEEQVDDENTESSASAASGGGPPFARHHQTSDEIASRIACGLAKLSMTKEYNSSTRFRFRHQLMTWWDTVSMKSGCIWIPNFCDGWLLRLLESTVCECTVSMLILLNAFLIGIVAHLDVKCAVTDSSCSFWGRPHIRGANTGLAIAFSLELLLRMFAQGWKFWCHTGWQLNALDSAVVLLSLIEEAGSGWSADLLHVRVLRCLRLLRTIRVVQTFTVFHTLRTLSNAIKESVMAFLWALMLIGLIIVMFSVAFTQGVAEFAESGGASENRMVFLETFFCSLPMTILTLFMCVTGGLDWWDVADLMLEIGPGHGLLFMSFVSVMILVLLNIVTGIFVNDALEQSQLDRDLMAKLEMERRERDMERLTKIFARMDSARIGKITLEQFLVHLDIPEVRALFSVMGLDISDAITFFESLDVDGSNDVALEEFVMGCMKLRGGAKTLDMATVLRENKRISDKLARHSTRLETQLTSLELQMTTIERIGIEKVRQFINVSNTLDEMWRQSASTGDFQRLSHLTGKSEALDFAGSSASVRRHIHL